MLLAFDYTTDTAKKVHMTIEVVLYPNLENNALRAADLSDIKDLSVLREKIKQGFNVTHTRKFIVLKGADRLVIAIGPIFGNYFHEDILAAAKKDYPALEISGGGSIQFGACYDRGTFFWNAKLGGTSGDFGTFDLAILAGDTPEKIAKSLGMSTEFTYTEEVLI